MIIDTIKHIDANIEIVKFVIVDDKPQSLETITTLGNLQQYITLRMFKFHPHFTEVKDHVVTTFDYLGRDRVRVQDPRQNKYQYFDVYRHPVKDTHGWYARASDSDRDARKLWRKK